MSAFDRFFKHVHKSNDGEIEYVTIKVLDMTDEELAACSELFGLYYGKYSREYEKKPGESVKMPVSYYRKNYCKPNYYVALAKSGDKLIGHAFYLRKDYSDLGFGTMTWVVQLVVDTQFRRRGIASKLLHSIWGFSDDYAWGLATTNPCTIRALESATFRKFKPKVVQKQLKAIRAIQADIPFAEGKEIFASRQTAQINTEFYVDNTSFVTDEDTYRRYGKLRPGYEWLAFTFRSQGIQEHSYQKHFGEMIQFSEQKLKEAYSRMNMEKHHWTRGTSNEVDFISLWGKNDSVLDLGCGIGRHAIELSLAGAMVTAVDFSEENINMAKAQAEERHIDTSRCEFILDDVRNFANKRVYDKVICMYDVIGSFPEDIDNRKIVQTAYRHLINGGYFILSVMNMEYTDSIIYPQNRGNIRRNMNILRKLPPSATMQANGNVFNPKFLAMDTETGLIYRKEQFNDDGLSAEFVICDKRYTRKEICRLLNEEGFDVIDERYVCVNHFDEKYSATDPHAKEICLVTVKK